MIVSGVSGELLANAYRNLQSQKKEYDSIMNQKANSQEPYLNHIRKAAKMGNKDAQKFLEKPSAHLPATRAFLGIRRALSPK